MSIAIQSRMHTIILMLSNDMRQPFSIAFRLVKLGYFTEIESAIEVVDRTLKAPYRRN